VKQIAAGQSTAGVQTQGDADMYWCMPSGTPITWVGDVQSMRSMCDGIQSQLQSRHQQEQCQTEMSAQHNSQLQSHSGSCLFVGIDMEWRAGPQTPVALIQVSTPLCFYSR
jgi:hypothetical protein